MVSEADWLRMGECTKGRGFGGPSLLRTSHFSILRVSFLDVRIWQTSVPFISNSVMHDTSHPIKQVRWLPGSQSPFC